MEFVSLLLGLFLTYALIQIIWTVFGVGKPKNLPPGPTPLPIIGNLHLLGNQLHESLAKLAEIHGPIMFLKLGRINTLVISSAEAAKEALQKHDLEFSSRYVLDAMNAHNYSSCSVAWLPVGDKWRSLRRILNANMFSTKALEARQHLRMKKVKELLEYCRKASELNQPINIGRAAFRTSLNLLSNTLFSKDLINPYEDSGQEYKEIVNDIMLEAGKRNIVYYFPVFKKIDPQGIRRKTARHFGKLLDVFEEVIKERSESGMSKLNEEVDVLDAWLKINEENPHEMDRTQMNTLFLDLCGAGTDTSSNTLEWAMIELVRNPSIMGKAKKELEEVIGKGNIVKENDVVRLPYLSCVIKETFRVHPPAPLVIRELRTQVNLNGYTVPKGALVFVNTWAIARDPTLWEEQSEFKPERFLVSNIDVQCQNFELLPFGAGRRMCPGLPIAIRMLPMMLGSLINNFNWNLKAGINHESLDVIGKYGITLQRANPLCLYAHPLD